MRERERDLDKEVQAVWLLPRRGCGAGDKQILGSGMRSHRTEGQDSDKNKKTKPEKPRSIRARVNAVQIPVPLFTVSATSLSGPQFSHL